MGRRKIIFLQRTSKLVGKTIGNLVCEYRRFLRNHSHHKTFPHWHLPVIVFWMRSGRSRILGMISPNPSLWYSTNESRHSKSNPHTRQGQFCLFMMNKQSWCFRTSRSTDIDVKAAFTTNVLSVANCKQAVWTWAYCRFGMNEKFYMLYSKVSALQ